jgi:hypothetical protein
MGMGVKYIVPISWYLTVLDSINAYVRWNTSVDSEDLYNSLASYRDMVHPITAVEKHKPLPTTGEKPT